MLYPVKAEQVYYHTLAGSPLIFSDERSKKKLLDLVFDLYRQQGWRLYAFCITDSKAYFLSATDGCSDYGENMQRTISEFLGWDARTADIWNGDSPTLQLDAVQRVNTMDEILYCCRVIHRLPLELNYVKQIQDYWWSSYNTYTGNFDWCAVDCRRILEYFDTDPETAVSRLRRFHSSFEVPTLYITNTF